MKYFLNTIYLYLAQGINLIFPILVYPFLIDRISLEGFGLIILLQVIMGYGITLVDYGYNLIGTSDISKAKSISDVNMIVSKALAVKTILLILSLILIITTALFVKPLQGQWEMIFLGWLNVLGVGFYPIWYFQGKEEMQLISIFNLISKLISILGILLFINDPSDIKLTVFLLSLASVLCALFSWIYIFVKDEVRFSVPLKIDIIDEFKYGFSILSSNTLVQVYSNFVLVISTGILNPIEIGVLGVYLKIRDVFMSVVGPIQQAVYPELARLINLRLKYQMRLLLKKTFLVLFTVSMISSVSYYFLFDFLNILLFENNAAIKDMLVFLCVVLVAPYGGLITKFLVAKGKNTYVFFSTLFSGILTLIASDYLVTHFGLTGALSIIFLSYLFNAILGTFFSYKN